MTNNVITILPNGTEICVSTSDMQVFVNNGLCIEINAGMGSNIGAWLSSLNEYDRDEDAGAVVGLNGWYRTSDSHDSLPGGVPKQVRFL